MKGRTRLPSYLNDTARVSKLYSEASPLNDRLWLVQLSQQLKDDADPILSRLQKHAVDSQALFHQFQPDLVQHLVHSTRQLSFANRIMILWPLLTSSSRLSFQQWRLESQFIQHILP